MRVGERIDLKKLERQRIGSGPVIQSIGADGHVVVFRYGVVVFCDVDPAAQQSLLERICDGTPPQIGEADTEEVTIRVDPQAKPGATTTGLQLERFGPNELVLVADVLAKSTALSYYEAQVEQVFRQVEPVAMALKREGRPGRSTRELVKQIGSTLLMEHQMVWRTQVDDKPELLWEHPELESLFAWVSDEYEISERDQVLSRRLQLISRTAQAMLELIHNRRSLRVEWYIVILIVVEIVLMLVAEF